MTSSIQVKQNKEMTNHSSQNDTCTKHKCSHCEYLEKVIALLPGHIYWQDKNGIFLGCNNSQIEDLGLNHINDIIGKTVYELQSTSVANVLSAINTKILESGEAYSCEEPHISKSGKEEVFLSNKIPLKNSSGEIIGIVGISIDITDRKKAEEYRIKHEAAEKVVKFTNLVAGSIAHELRTPLAGINSYMDLIEMSLASTKQTQQDKDEFLSQAVNKIKSTIKATTHVINDLLLKVRTFATGQVPQKGFEEISISTDIENLLDSFPFESNEQVLVKVSYNTRFKYLGDKVLTSHVLGNLLKNALHAVKEADKGEIIIELKKDGDFNQLVFRDTALGISEEFVNKIFDQFETKKTTHGGSGLGLAFCKMVMDYYGGSITCNSKEGEYTEFVLNFPSIK